MNLSCRSRVVGGAVALALLAASAVAGAQEAAPHPAAQAQPGAAAQPGAQTQVEWQRRVAGLPPGETPDGGARTLSGHTFQRGSFVDFPFIASYFGVQTRVGYVTGTDDGIALNEAAVHETLTAAVQVSSRVQLALDATYSADFGTDTTSIFQRGGNLGVQGAPGVRIELLRSDKYGSYLSLHPAGVIKYEPGVTPANLLLLIQSEISTLAGSTKRLNCLAQLKFGCAFPGFNVLGAIQTSTSEFGGRLGVDYAQAAGKYFGVQTSAAFQVTGAHASAFDKNTSRTASIDTVPIHVEAGIQPALNLYPLAGIGFTAEYLIEHDSQSSGSTFAQNDLTHNFAFGVHYTGRRDLQLGLDGTVSVDTRVTTKDATQVTLNIDTFSGAFDLIYYF